MKEQSVLKSTVLITVIAINLMLGGLLVSKNIIKINGITPAIAAPSEHTARIDFVMEFTGEKTHTENPNNSMTGHEEIWLVEHYKEYEIHYNKQGEVIFKEPTGKEENIRYWKDKINYSD